MGRNKKKNELTIDVKDRDVILDWYNAYFRVEYEMQAKADGAFVAADVASAPVNGSFSLIRSLEVNSAGKDLYEANGVHKVVFIKTCWNSPTTMHGVWRKTSFGISTMTI